MFKLFKPKKNKSKSQKVKPVKYLIIGNGPSSKKLLEYDLDFLFNSLKKRGFKVIVINKFLRLLKQKQTEFPDYYVAGDSFINLQIYDLFFKYQNNFSKLFISWPFLITHKYIYKSFKLWKVKSSILGLDRDKIKFLKLVKRNLFKVDNVKLIHHSNSGLFALKLPCIIENTIFSKKKIDIYCVGLDENYNNINQYETSNISKKDNDDYLSHKYLSKNDVVSPVLKNRIESMNKIILYNQKRKKIRYFNLSPITRLDFTYNQGLDNFLSKYIR